MEIVVPESGDGGGSEGANSGRRAYEHGGGLDDGGWHTIRITFGPGSGVVHAHLDNETVGSQITLDASDVDLLRFVADDSTITVGSGSSYAPLESAASGRTESLPLTRAAALSDSGSNFFRGCIGEVGIIIIHC